MFSSVELSDHSQLSQLFFRYGQASSDHSFVNAFGWQRVFCMQKALLPGGVCLRFVHEGYGLLMLYPVGPEPQRAYQALCRELEPGEYDFLCLGSQELPPNTLRVEPVRDLWDYLHRASDLVDYPGKELRTQRQQAQAFWREYPGARLELCDFWGEELPGAVSDLWDPAAPATAKETSFLKTVLPHARVLGLLGANLWVGEQCVGFTLASWLKPEVLNVHVEKANVAYKGVYAALRQGFLRELMARQAVAWVNREEDMGLLPLREAKLRLRPCHFVEKSRVTVGI